MTSRQYGKRAIFVSGDVRFQDGDAVDLGKLGGGGAFFCLLFLSFNVCNMRYYMLSSCTRIALPFYYDAVACVTFGYFLCMSMCVAYSTDYIQ